MSLSLGPHKAEPKRVAHVWFIGECNLSRKSEGQVSKREEVRIQAPVPQGGKCLDGQVVNTARPSEEFYILSASELTSTACWSRVAMLANVP